MFTVFNLTMTNQQSPRGGYMTARGKGPDSRCVVEDKLLPPGARYWRLMLEENPPRVLIVEGVVETLEQAMVESDPDIVARIVQPPSPRPPLLPNEHRPPSQHSFAHRERESVEDAEDPRLVPADEQAPGEDASRASVPEAPVPEEPVAEQTPPAPAPKPEAPPVTLSPEEERQALMKAMGVDQSRRGKRDRR